MGLPALLKRLVGKLGDIADMPFNEGMIQRESDRLGNGHGEPSISDYYRRPNYRHSSPVVCPYCGGAAKLADSKLVYGQSYGFIYLCSNWPNCDSYVGVNRVTGKPLGTLANAELRGYRKQAHAVFDITWKSGKMTRTKAYEKLAHTLGLPPDKTHIGMFNIETCKKVIAVFDTER